MRSLISAVVITLLLAVAADRAAKYVVQDRLASHIESEERTHGVDVEIEGFPFLTQVAQNRFDEVNVSLPTLDADTVAGSVLVVNVDVELQDVNTSDRYTRATAESATGSAFIPYEAFEEFEISVVYGGETSDGRTYLRISVPGLSGREIRVLPDVADGLSFNLGMLDLVGQSLPDAWREVVLHTYSVAGLPSGITIKDITATEDGLALTVTGSDITMTG